MKEAEDGTKCKMLQGCIYSFMYYFILFYFILFGPLEIIPMVFKKILLLFMLITVVLLNIFETLIIFLPGLFNEKIIFCNNKKIFNFDQ